MAKTKRPSGLIPVLLTTDKDKRGVFFGYIEEKTAHKDDLVVYDAQMAIYWSSDVKGVLGLAATGPTKSCRISKPVPKALIKGVVFVGTVTDDAERAWRKQPWSE